MTDQERQLIEGLASRIQNAPAPQVDRDADELIRRGIGGRPDALYILTQTVLIQEMALDQAKAQIEQLKKAPQPSNTSFLGQAAQPSGYQGSNYQRDAAPPPQQYAPQYAPPQYEAAPPPSGGRFSGFLHNAAQTAAGIVAGEVAFSALSSIFGGHGGGGGFFGGGGSGFLGGGGVSPGSETIINNYYDEPGGSRSPGSGFGSSDGGLSPDLEDRRFAGSDAQGDTHDDTPDDNADDTQDNDQTDSSDNSADDSSSYDDGSGSGDV